MATEYDNILICNSNPNLLQTMDPRKIIKESPAKFISCKNGEYYYQSRRFPIDKDVYRLSKEFPGEEFIVKIWNVDALSAVMLTVIYKDGDHGEIIRIEPHFHYECRSPRLMDVLGEERFFVFFKKITSFFEKLKGLYYEEWLESYDPNEPHKAPEYDKINIQFEDDEFKVLATWDCFSYIVIEGFFKVSNKTSWKLIDGHSYIPRNNNKTESIKNEDDDDYDSLPF